jgi:glycosyltransferase involved in cell wall biosynthesis
MRILTVCSGLELGGTERAAQNFTLGYHRAGHQSAFLNWGMHGPRQEILENHDIPVFTAAGNLNHALAEADGFNPDIIHIHRRGWKDDRETYILKRLRRPERRILEQNVFGSIDYSPASDLIDVHMQLSKWCIWRWRRYLGKKNIETAGVIIPYPIVPTDFEPASKQEIETFFSRHSIDMNAYICGRVGQPFPGKWHPKTLIAFAELARLEPKAVLLLIGMPRSYQKIINSFPSDIQKRILQFPLTNSDDELKTFYSSLDCFIHATTQGESFGFVLTEAMLCGCPVVTVNQPHKDNSQVEVVGHMKGGIVAGSMKKLSEAVVMLWSDQELRQKIQKNVRASVIDRYDLTKVVATALHVAEIALSSGDRKTLIQLLNEDRSLQTKVDDKEIYSLYHNTLGNPSLRDIFLMNISHNPFIYQTKTLLHQLLRKD